jgi:hypothetical protein
MYGYTTVGFFYQIPTTDTRCFNWWSLSLRWLLFTLRSYDDILLYYFWNERYHYLSQYHTFGGNEERTRYYGTHTMGVFRMPLCMECLFFFNKQQQQRSTVVKCLFRDQCKSRAMVSLCLSGWIRRSYRHSFRYVVGTTHTHTHTKRIVGVCVFVVDYIYDIYSTPPKIFQMPITFVRPQQQQGDRRSSASTTTITRTTTSICTPTSTTTTSPPPILVRTKPKINAKRSFHTIIAFSVFIGYISHTFYTILLQNPHSHSTTSSIRMILLARSITTTVGQRMTTMRMAAPPFNTMTRAVSATTTSTTSASFIRCRSGGRGSYIDTIPSQRSITTVRLLNILRPHRRSSSSAAPSASFLTTTRARSDRMTIGGSTTSQRLSSTTTNTAATAATVGIPSDTTPILLQHIEFSQKHPNDDNREPRPVVLFLHGLLGNKRNFASIGRSIAASSFSQPDDHHVRTSSPQQKQPFIIYSLDLRNHGDSYTMLPPEHQETPSLVDMSYRSMAYDVIHFCNVHNITQIDTLIGHSIGGKVAQ